MAHSSKGCILFDWGDTLMRDFKEFSGPMKDWPRVEAVQGAAEMLSALYPDWTLALATNAADSDEEEIRLALQRVGLAVYLDKIYCFKTIGHKKPSLEFFNYILNDLGLSPKQWSAIITRLTCWAPMPADCRRSGSTNAPGRNAKTKGSAPSTSWARCRGY